MNTVENIHPSAIIDPSADIHPSAKIGAYAIIGANVSIGAESIIEPHVVIKGPTRIGKLNHIFSFACIGDAPQDKKYAGEPTELHIGDNNVIREYCSLNRGTAQDAFATRIGNNNLLMAYVHVAHDCQIGDHVILANNTTLAGHVHVGDHAILGGFTKVHQFVRIGTHSFMAFDTGLSRDVPPYVMTSGHPASPRGINKEGLKRRGFNAEEIKAIMQAYRFLYRNDLKLDEAKLRISELSQEHNVLKVFNAFFADSTRSIVR
ncbi:MAG: acyl-ACP--UDP-N-acetylglucosamine O-acyltransferase [Gammaproteobacteria bacterium]|nr:acyl-ACP--UDP-N-acetylglucosamine O-acyltransferase [Gammaproteobacteria bacterium]NNC97841.1 acyl-ACP--UDP-N-acetylglucosamine O-acyltransferase [Gammaproteobacteria bacterium]NNM13714.1 acyl-ACP--UDP-N-acetylglucosamine O-acyltransferase [Gammaproteobacteria bacterium]